MHSAHDRPGLTPPAAADAAGLPSQPLPQPAPAPARQSSLHIERLVIDGLPLSAAQGRRLQAALEGELTRLLSGHLQQARWQSGSLAALRASALEFEDADETVLGCRIAQQLLRALEDGR